MSEPEIRKQISMFMPLSWWKAIRDEAAKRRCSMTELTREWIGPHIKKLMRKRGRK